MVVRNWLDLLVDACCKLADQHQHPTTILNDLLQETAVPVKARLFESNECCPGLCLLRMHLHLVWCNSAPCALTVGPVALQKYSPKFTDACCQGALMDSSALCRQQAPNTELLLKGNDSHRPGYLLTCCGRQSSNITIAYSI